MPKAPVTNLALERIVRDLEKLKAEAEALGDDGSLLTYLIDMALIEATTARATTEKSDRQK
jgi:hypothetical protein